MGEVAAYWRETLLFRASDWSWQCRPISFAQRFHRLMIGMRKGVGQLSGKGSISDVGVPFLVQSAKSSRVSGLSGQVRVKANRCLV